MSKNWFEGFKEGDNITITVDFVEQAKISGMWEELGNALLDYMVELKGVNDTIEWLASMGFSEDNIKDMGFDL